MPDDPPRVFGIGHPKSGSTSLLLALEILGWPTETIAFLPTDPDERERFRRVVPETLARNARADRPPLDGLPYRVAADRIYDRFGPLGRHYPEAKFIITYRDPHEIALSAWRHAHRQITLGDQYPEQWTDYRAVLHSAIDHYQRVLAWSLSDSVRDRVLLMRLCDGEGWGTLCPFLGLPEPDAPFPRGNASQPARSSSESGSGGVTNDR